ncbi:stability/partitioning determinant [Serratia liquefaciens]|uniref:stability/partitioning determinant n=1 Tax=Serratia liquefaciens TaxID=614 RepID=UPI00390578E1
MVQLKKTLTTPTISAAQAPAIVAPQDQDKSQGSTARFIAAGDSRPTVEKSRPSTFRLPVEIQLLLEAESTDSGQNKTAVLKAALLAFSQLDQNQKNNWLLSAHRY